MMSSRIIPICRYHMSRQLRSAGTWILVSLITMLAMTQGMITEHTPALIKSLAGPGMANALAATLAEPSWQESYAGWARNLSQTISLAFIVMNALTCAKITTSSDIPFILTRNVRRSDYLIWATFSVWFLTYFLAFLGATITWFGTILFFPKAPYLPVLAASLVWGLEMVIISACQTLAATWKTGAGAPLAGGLGVYFLITIAGMWDRATHSTPLALGRISVNLAQNAPDQAWFWPTLTTLLLIGFLTGSAAHRFTRIELG